jgi:hypothetical protein
MLIKRFGETFNKIPSEQWYELADGTRCICDEGTLDTIWFEWVTWPESTRLDFIDHTVFEFEKPVEIKL